jgi:hypothetical protein
VSATTEQKVDFLLKKVGFTLSKTGSVTGTGSISGGTTKEPFAESLPSPLVVPDSSIWNQSLSIPTTPPGSDTAIVKVYSTSSALRMTADSSVSGSRAFIAYTTYNNTSSARLTDWIDTQFGTAYVLKVYKGDPNSGGTLLPAGGSGSNDGWFFDYSSGVLNFNGSGLPSGVTDSNIYIVGYRYIGSKGVSSPGQLSPTNLFVAGISTFVGVGTFQSDLSVAGQFKGYTNLVAPHSATTKNFTVTVASKDASHRYNGTGSGNAYLIDGIQAPILTLTPGRTYRFTNDNTGSHPLKFYLEADKTTNYTTGVNFQNTYTEITVSDETPNVLHYQCTAHGYMGNAIVTNSNVVNSNYAATLRGGLNVSGGETVLSSATVSDLTDNRVVIAGTSGVLEDSGNLTFNGSQLGITGTVNASSTITGTEFHTGASGSAIRVTSNTISGPATFTLDPAAVGDNTGKVIIAGDLQVDGTTTTVNSTTVNIVDKNIQVATGAANDAAANGGGITIASGSGNKTFQFEATGSNLASSENLNLASGKVYKINNTEVISATQLGSTVLASVLTSVGTLTSLNVSGITSFTKVGIADSITFNHSPENYIQHIPQSGIDIVSAGSNKAITYSADNHYFLSGDSTGTHALFNKNASTQLFFNNNLKLETNNTGAVVTGILSATSFTGDGSNLSGVPAVANQANNRLITCTGTTDSLNGESTLLFSNSNLLIGLTASPVSSSTEQGVFLSGANSTQSVIASDATPFVVNRVGTGNQDRNCIEFRNNGNLRGTIGAIGGSNGIFFQSGVTERARISSGGNFGISTTNPTSKLHVVGHALVSGVTTSTGGFSGNLSGTATLATDLAINGTNQIVYQDSNNDSDVLPTGNAGQILASSGAGAAPQWVNSAPAGAIEGITIRDESTIVGTANSISTINFIGSVVTADAAAGAGIATVTVNAIAGLGISEGSGSKATGATGLDFVGPLIGVDASSNTGISTVRVDALTIKDEGSTVGTAGSITTINFVGAGIAAAVSGDTATVTSAGGVTNADVVALAIALG